MDDLTREEIAAALVIVSQMQAMVADAIALLGGGTDLATCVQRASEDRARLAGQVERLTRDLAEARAVVQTYRAALALLEDARAVAVAARDEARAQLAAMARPGIVETTMPHTLSDVWRGRRRGE